MVKTQVVISWLVSYGFETALQNWTVFSSCPSTPAPLSLLVLYLHDCSPVWHDKACFRWLLVYLFKVLPHVTFEVMLLDFIALFCL